MLHPSCVAPRLPVGGSRHRDEDRAERGRLALYTDASAGPGFLVGAGGGAESTPAGEIQGHSSQCCWLEPGVLQLPGLLADGAV